MIPCRLGAISIRSIDEFWEVSKDREGGQRGTKAVMRKV